MRGVKTTGKWVARAAAWSLGLALACLASPLSHAQVSSYGDKQMGEVSDHPPAMLNKITITQKLNTQIPLGGEFRDETGKTVHLGDYFGKHPVILSLVYYQCKILCPEEIDGLVSSLEMVKFKPGKDFDVVFVSIDPSETPEMAAREKALYLKRYGHPETANGWHYLTGQQPAINQLAQAVGFGYVKMAGPDGVVNQYGHASAIELLTPDGKLSQYYLGVDFAPNDLRLGLVEASAGKIGSPVDAILTYCYRYDPALNRHSLIVARVVQLGGLITVFGLGSYIKLILVVVIVG